jgi:hypothetical protein
MLDVERWKCCVVHLEAAADSADKDRREAALRKASGWLLSGGYPSDDEYAEGSQGLRDVRFRGTAAACEISRPANSWVTQSEARIRADPSRRRHQAHLLPPSVFPLKGSDRCCQSQSHIVTALIRRVQSLLTVACAAAAPPARGRCTRAVLCGTVPHALLCTLMRLRARWAHRPDGHDAAVVHTRTIQRPDTRSRA